MAPPPPDKHPPPPVGGGSAPVEIPPYVTSVGAITLVGGTAEPVLARALKMRSADIQACYAKAVTKKPALSGVLKITFTIATSGAFTAASVDASDLKDIDLESCVIGVVQATRTAASGIDRKAGVSIKFTKNH